LAQFHDPVTSLHLLPRPNITHFMPPSILGLLGIHDRFSYLFGLWKSMELDDPGVVNLTRKPSSILPTPHSILSSVFPSLSCLPHPLAFPPIPVAYSPPASPDSHYVAHTLVSWQLSSSSPQSLHIDVNYSPYTTYLLFTSALLSSTARYTNNRGIKFARVAGHVIIQRGVKDKAKR